MGEVYYTTLTRNQVNVLFACMGKKITVTQNMINYLYALARQGREFARDRQEEAFRQRIRSAVDLVIREEYTAAENEIWKAFRFLCAARSSEQLDKIGQEVEIRENVDYPETDLRSVIEGDMRPRRGDNEEFAQYGYTRQEFNAAGELENTEEETGTMDAEDVADDMAEFSDSYEDA